MKQGSEEWLEERKGVATASRFGDITTLNRKLKTPAWQASKGSSYLYEIVAEGFCDERWQGNEHSDRGKSLESEAVDHYELSNGVEALEAGFIWHESESYGGSPDRMIGDDGGLEIKCPKASIHVGYMDEGVIPVKYRPQVYGLMHITGAQWWDFESYHRNMQPFVSRATVDDDDYKKWLEVFLVTIEAFNKRLSELKAKVSVPELIGG